MYPIKCLNDGILRRIEGVDLSLHKKILKLYELEIERRLLSGNTYAVSNERTTDCDDRNTIVFRVKQVNKSSAGYRKMLKNKNINFDQDLGELLTTPSLKLVMEKSFKEYGIGGQIFEMKASKSFVCKLIEIPVTERYKFPKE